MSGSVEKREYYAKNRDQINLNRRQRYSDLSIEQRRSMKSPNDPARQWIYNLSRSGASLEWYEKTFQKQGGVCSICGKPPEVGKRLAVDHNHLCCESRRSCGSCLRGLLCDKCNRGIGLLGDSLDMLKKASDYLMEYK